MEPTICRSPSLNFFSGEELEELHFASLEILERTGVVIQHPEAVKLLYEAGAFVENNKRVRIPSSLVKQALSTAPERVVICDRLGNRKMFLEHRRIYFGTGSDLKFTIDYRTGKRRISCLKDIEESALLSDGLKNIDFVMSYGLASDVPTHLTELKQLEAMITNTTKPLILTTFSEKEVIEKTYQIGCLLAGGKEEFSRKPFFIIYGQFISPLVHNKDGLDRLLFCSERFIPIIYVPTIMAGASGPATMAGALALGNAEVLTGLVISQLKRKGASFIYGGCVSPFDMRDSILPYGAPEWHMADVIMSQLSQRYRLPIFGTAGCSDSKLPDEQAAMEGSYSLLLAALGGTNLIHDVGYLEGGLTGSLKYIAMMNESIGITRRVMKNFEITQESLALDVTDKVGPGGNFLTEEHTLKHYRKASWYPELLNRQTYDNWKAAGSKTLRERCREFVQKLLSEHKVLKLSEKEQKEIKKIIGE